MRNGKEMLPSFRVVLLGCLALFCASCSTVEPFRLNNPAVNIVWPSLPNIPRIKYLCDITGPEEIFPPKSKFQKFSEMITGDNRVMLDLLTPYSVTINDKNIIYIADTSAGVVHRYDLTSREVEYILKAGEENLASPVAVALDQEDNLYISDSVLGKVFKYDNNGVFLKELVTPTGFKRPAGIAISKSDEKYVVDALAQVLHKCDKDDNYVGEFPKQAPGQELNTPTHVALDADGNVYVTDALNFVIKVYDPNGKLIKRIGEIGDVPGSFARPKGVALDSEGDIYVVDANHDNFQIFNQKGQLLLFVGKNGSGPGEFYLPSGIHIDKHDRIFVADTFNRRIQVFQFLKAGGNK